MPEEAAVAQPKGNNNPTTLGYYKDIYHRQVGRIARYPALRSKASPDTHGLPRWTDHGDYKEGFHFKPPVPHRDETSVLDPVSHLCTTSAAHDHNVEDLKTFPTVNMATDEPHKLNPFVPATAHIGRRDRSHELAELRWNSRKSCPAGIRARRMNWIDDTPVDEKKFHFKKPDDPAPASVIERDQMAKHYMYTSSTQSMYEEVPWDRMIHPKIPPPLETKEEKPDMVSARFQPKEKRFFGTAFTDGYWKEVGITWDQLQLRKGFYPSKMPDDMNFTSHYPRVNQVPLYGGVSGGYDKEDVDNPSTPFQPYNTVRSKAPKECDSTWRPNIPGYGGRSNWEHMLAQERGLASARVDPLPTTYRVSYGSTPFMPKPPSSRSSDISRMVTTVPPSNPSKLPSKSPTPSQTHPLDLYNAGHISDSFGKNLTRSFDEKNVERSFEACTQ